MSKALAIRVLLSIGLEYVSCWFFGKLDRLPYSPFRDQVSDAVAMPGGLVAGIFYPQGIHTGSGASAWADQCVAANIAIYSILWLVVLTLLNWRYVRRRTELRHPCGGVPAGITCK